MRGTPVLTAAKMCVAMDVIPLTNGGGCLLCSSGKQLIQGTEKPGFADLPPLFM